jgi:hypothetical protein
MIVLKLALVGFCALAAIAAPSSRRFRQGFSAGIVRSPRTAEITKSDTTHGVFANIVIGTLVLGSLGHILLMKENFPFSYYPMFMGVQDPLITQNQVYGCAGEQEISIGKLGNLYPLDAYRLHPMISVAEKTGPEAMKSLADALLRLYRDNQEQLDRPNISGLRFYRVEWTLTKDAANVTVPDRKVLLYDQAANR